MIKYKYRREDKVKEFLCNFNERNVSAQRFCIVKSFEFHEPF